MRAFIEFVLLEEIEMGTTTRKLLEDPKRWV